MTDLLKRTENDMSTAQRIAALLSDDGMRYVMEDGRTLDDVCAAEDVIECEALDEGGTRWVFEDDSVIVDTGCGWDIGLSPRCACMSGAGHIEGCPEGVGVTARHRYAKHEGLGGEMDAEELVRLRGKWVR